MLPSPQPQGGEAVPVRGGRILQNLTTGVRGIALLFDLNWDLLFAAGMIAVALLAGAFLSTAGLGF